VPAATLQGVFIAHALTASDIPREVAGHFWAKVEQTDGCWLWNGRIADDGYGQFAWKIRRTRRNTTRPAHRIAYVLLRGPLPPGSTIDHLCHKPEACVNGSACPHRRCVRPDHLAITDPATNTMRGASLGAHNAIKTHCPKGHPLAFIGRERRRRYCITCRREARQRGGVPSSAA
jgi:hypothetical protein